MIETFEVEDIGDTVEIEQDKNDDKEEGKSLKVILVGESGVGKTCIIHRYVNGKFDDETLSTIAISSKEKTIRLKDENKTKITSYFPFLLESHSIALSKLVPCKAETGITAH